MNFISLFSGVGGFDLGLSSAGMECKAQVELDKNCQEILQAHWNVPLIADVKTAGKHNLPPADLICGGFPCQDISLAGERRGLKGERSGLWFEFQRIIAEINPRWVIIENVPGLLTSNGGEDFSTVLQGLAECGYYVCWRILDAQYFGSAGTRRRIFIVAGNERSREVLFGEGAIGAVLSTRKTGAGPKPMLVGWDGGLSYERLRQCIISKGRFRKLTPLEQTRIMGFPDDWFGEQSDRLTYRQLGNSVSVQCIEWLGKRIVGIDKSQDL